MQLLANNSLNSKTVLQVIEDRRIVSIKVEYRKLYALCRMVTLPMTLVDPEPYVIVMTLSVLKGHFPMQAGALSQRHSAVVPKCPRTSAELSTH